MAPTPFTDTLLEFHAGLHLKDTLLWFDAPTPRQLCFVSHANIPGASLHQKILATEHTASLLRAMGAAHGRGRRAHEPQALVSPYGQSFTLGQLRLELFPSGHLLGSASLLVHHKKRRIVYAGHINLRTSPLAERLEVRGCDILVLACPFGQRHFAFPPLEQVTGALVRFTTQTLQQGSTPVIFCSPVGEAQEVIAALLKAGIRCRAHRRIYAACQVYQAAGKPIHGVRSFTGQPGGDEAMIWPMALRDSPSLARLSATRTALASGLAMDEQTSKRLACDATFPLSTHSDYAGLLEYIRACQPGQVILMQSASGDLIEDLEALGLAVSRIEAPRQMDLF